MTHLVRLMACSDYDSDSACSYYDDLASSASVPTRSPSAPSSARSGVAVPELVLVRLRDDGCMVMRREDEIEDEEGGVNMGSPYPGFEGHLAVGRRGHHHLQDQLHRPVAVVVVSFVLVLMPRGPRAERDWGVGGNTL